MCNLQFEVKWPFKQKRSLITIQSKTFCGITEQCNNFTTADKPHDRLNKSTFVTGDGTMSLNLDRMQPMSSFDGMFGHL